MTHNRINLCATLLALCALLGSCPAIAQSDMAQARSLAATCSNCHGTNGVATVGMVPLAGYNKADLVKNMSDFKSGTRPATIMHQLSKGYSESQIEAIASYFAAQKK